MIILIAPGIMSICRGVLSTQDFPHCTGIAREAFKRHDSKCRMVGVVIFFLNIPFSSGVARTSSLPIAPGWLSLCRLLISMVVYPVGKMLKVGECNSMPLPSQISAPKKKRLATRPISSFSILRAARASTAAEPNGRDKAGANRLSVMGI